MKKIKNISATFLAVLSWSISLAQAQVVFNSPALDSLVRFELGLAINDPLSEEKALELTTLNASSLNLTSINGIEYLLNLEILNLSNNQLEDIRPLASLPNLIYLDLAFNNLSDVGALLIVSSETLTISIARNCIADVNVLKENLINPVIFIGLEAQNLECGQPANRLDNFFVRSLDLSTKEVEFVFKGRSDNGQMGMIDFGNGQNMEVLIDGFSQMQPHIYENRANTTATLTLGSEQLTVSVGLALNEINLLSPANEAQLIVNQNNEDIIKFDWDDIISAANYELVIMDDKDSVVVQQLSGTSKFDFNPNLELNTNYRWRVRSLDGVSIGPWSVLFSFSLLLTVPNNAPTDISITSSDINENESVGTIVGSLTTTDADVGDSFTYTLVSGTGSMNNSSFNISGNNLITTEIFDFETKSSYSIRIQTSDGNGGIFAKEFAIIVLDVLEPLTNIVSGNNRINIYPNPVQENIHIVLEDYSANNIKLVLVNLTGEKTLIIEEIKNHIVNKMLTIPTKEMSSGIYILSLINKSDGLLISKKIMIK